jgi:hypothetical protein
VAVGDQVAAREPAEQAFVAGFPRAGVVDEPEAQALCLDREALGQKSA